MRIVLLFCACATAAVSAQPRAVSLVIAHATVIPMTRNDAVLLDHTIGITGDRITAVGPSSSVAVPADVRVIDGRGKFVVPGLADMHVHLEYFDDPAILGLFVDRGITTVRNMDGRPYILDWKRRIAAGTLSGPRIYSAGPILDGKPPVRDDNTVVDTPVDARTIIDAQAAAGYDFVKVYSGLSADVYQSILAAAKVRALPVAGHVPRSVGLEQALVSGQRAIEHLGDYANAIEADSSSFKGKFHWSKRYLAAPIDKARLQTIAGLQSKQGVWTVPTLIQPMRELLRGDEMAARLASDEVRLIPPDGRRQWEEMTRRIAARMDDEDWKLVAAGAIHRHQVVAALHNAGVSLLMGTDTPNPFVVPGFSLHDELALAVTAGLSPADALAASTREAARFINGDWGTLENGKAADLLVLDANPLQDIANTRRIADVVMRGRVIDRRAR
jgi:imidazolonepropionase-like amidohydrolase